MPSSVLRSTSDWCVVIACLGLLLPVSSFGSEYDAVYLGPGSARAINNLGQVVGVDPISQGPDSGPWFWSFDTGRLSLTAMFGRDIIDVTDINDNMEIAGRLRAPQGVFGFLGKYPEGYVVIFLDPRDTGSNLRGTYASSVSNLGLVVGSGGSRLIGPRVGLGLVWDRSGAVVRRLGSVIGSSVDDPMSISDDGSLVFTRPDGRGQVWYSDGRSFVLPEDFVPTGINASGVVVGSLPRGAIWTEADGLRILNGMGRTKGINNRGTVAGNGNRVWTELDGVRSMGCPAASPERCEASEAWGINDLGWVVGEVNGQALLRIPPSIPELIDSVPADGYIDPRAETGGIDEITLTFNVPVDDATGIPVNLDTFRVSTSPSQVDAPRIFNVRTSPNRETVTVTLDGPISVGVWTTVTGSVVGPLGDVSTVSVRVAHLPCDIDQNGVVNIRDATAFGDEFRGTRRPELIDLNRSSTVNISDATTFGTLWRGEASRPWNGARLSP